MHPTLLRLYGVLEELGLYEEAENMRNNTLKMHKLLYGNKAHPEVAGSYANLGLFYKNQSKYDLAKEKLHPCIKSKIRNIWR